MVIFFVVLKKEKVAHLWDGIDSFLLNTVYSVKWSKDIFLISERNLEENEHFNLEATLLVNDLEAILPNATLLNEESEQYVQETNPPLQGKAYDNFNHIPDWFWR